MIFPALMLILLLGTQAAMYYHARSVAIGAAADGARAQSLERAAGGDGASAAYSFITQAGGDDVLRGARVNASHSTTSATVTVSGTSMSLIPGWDPSVTQSATVPLERITQ
ncbi:TadE family protein [Janibacter indicus]|nr:TadE family protein [Janibacter indicus]